MDSPDEDAAEQSPDDDDCEGQLGKGPVASQGGAGRAGRAAKGKVTKNYQDILFELATSVCCQMVRIGASEDKAKALVSRIVTQHGLDEVHEDTLGTLITNVSRAVEVVTK